MYISNLIAYTRIVQLNREGFDHRKSALSKGGFRHKAQYYDEKFLFFIGILVVVLLSIAML